MGRYTLSTFIALITLLAGIGGYLWPAYQTVQDLKQEKITLQTALNQSAYQVIVPVAMPVLLAKITELGEQSGVIFEKLRGFADKIEIAVMGDYHTTSRFLGQLYGIPRDFNFDSVLFLPGRLKLTLALLPSQTSAQRAIPYFAEGLSDPFQANHLADAAQDKIGHLQMAQKQWILKRDPQGQVYAVAE